MVKRKPLPPDTRLNWRDPDMPVIRLNKHGKSMEVAPDYIKQYYDQKINSPFYGAPHYKDDPTYDWAKFLK